MNLYLVFTFKTKTRHSKIRYGKKLQRSEMAVYSYSSELDNT